MAQPSSVIRPAPAVAHERPFDASVPWARTAPLTTRSPERSGKPERSRMRPAGVPTALPGFARICAWVLTNRLRPDARSIDPPLYDCDPDAFSVMPWARTRSLVAVPLIVPPGPAPAPLSQRTEAFR